MSLNWQCPVHKRRQPASRTVLVAMTKEFCGITRARLTSPAWLICCTTCTLPAAAPNPPTWPRVKSCSAVHARPTAHQATRWPTTLETGDMQQLECSRATQRAGNIPADLVALLVISADIRLCVCERQVHLHRNPDIGPSDAAKVLSPGAAQPPSTLQHSWCCV
jgi:hypothetical protein